MDINLYVLLHIIGIAALFIGLGGMLAADSKSRERRLFAIWQGAGLVIILVSGFGMFAKLHLVPLFAVTKFVLWAALAVLPVLARRRVLPTGVAVVLAVVLAGVLAWIGLHWQAWLPGAHV